MHFIKRLNSKNRRKVPDSPPVRYESEQKPDICPRCGSTLIARIAYGLPTSFEERQKQIENKEVVSGGCVVRRNNPSWKCTSCEADIYRTA